MAIESIISLSISILVGLIILICVLKGIIGGFKKSLTNGIINICLVVLLFFLTKTLTGLIINADLSGLNINIGGEKLTSINQYIVNMLNSNPQLSSIINNPEAVKLITQLPLMLASPFVFTILFWILKLIVLIVSAIVGLFSLIFRRKKKKVQQFDKNGIPIRTPKKKKHRLVGGLIGFVGGLVLVLATFVPIFGVGNILLQLNNIKVDDNGAIVPETSIVLYAEETPTETNKSLLTVILGENIQKIVDLYDNNIGINIARFTGVETLGTIAFNNLASTKIDNTTIKLGDEVKNVVNVYSDYSNLLTYLKKETLTEEEMTKALNIVDNFIGDSFKINVLNIMGDIILPKIVDGLLNDPNFEIKLPEEITQNQLSNMLVTAALNEIKDYPFEEIKPILVNINSILKTLNENHILTPVYNSFKTGVELSKTDYINLIKNSSDTFSSDITGAIEDIKFIKDMSPTFIDATFTLIFNFMNLNYETNNISIEKSYRVISTAIENAINGIKTLDLTTELFATTETFAYVGNILNLLKDTEVLSDTQYNNLANEIEDLINYVMPISNLSNAIDNISEVTDWNDEMSKFSLVFNDIKMLYADYSKEENILDALELVRLGRIFDGVKNTKIFKDELQTIFNNFLEEAKTLNSTTENFAGVLETLKIQETEINWEKEFTSIKPLLTSIFEIDTQNLTDLNSALNLLDVIKQFDNVEQDANSAIYSTKMETLLKEVMNSIKTLSNNETISNIATNVNTKIDARTTESLETCVIKGIFISANNLIPNASEFSDENISAMISEIKNNITNSDNGTLTNVNFRAEIDYMLDFADQIENLQNFENLTNEQIEEVSSFLDSLSGSKIFGDSKTHIINFVFDTAINYITSDELGIITLLEELKETNTIENISTLLDDINIIKENISTLTTIDTSNISTLDTEEIANALEEVKSTATFEDDFTNSIFENLLDEINTDIQSSQLPTSIKENIDSYINNANLLTNTYKEILDGLKELIPNN